VSRYVLTPLPLTPERFAPFGDVISTSGATAIAMKEARFDRFDALSTVDIDPDGIVAISIVRSRVPSVLPFRIERVERHPLGSQAFIPVSRLAFLVVVGGLAN
jgi:ureidoglycolate lyase